MSGVWVFGYGSLVDPASFGQTLGRPLELDVDVFPAELTGFGRRWNYGVLHVTGRTTDDDGVESERTIVALGIVPAPEETVNGVVAWVSDEELVALDLRERHYDRVDVTGAVTVDTELPLRGGVAVYVPRNEAIAHYERARRAGTAAIEQRYWDLVDLAFANLGDEHHDRYRRTTPAPDVPVLEVRRP